MRDPIDELSGFDPGPPMPALPAPEVRRLGDRRRRRATLLTGVGAALAVAIVVAPIAVVAGSGDGDDVQPAPAPSASATAGGPRGDLPTIPDGIDLTVGMPENESGEPVRASRHGDGIGSALAVCGRLSWAAEGFSDRLVATATGPEGTGAARELRAYFTDALASEALSDMVAAVEACPQEKVGTTTLTHGAAPSELGDESALLTLTYEQGGVAPPATTWWQVVRVGNALLVHMTGGEIQPGPDLDAATAADAETLTPLVDSLCVFSAEGCGGPVLGPDGYGDLEIGMSVDEAIATGDVGVAADDLPPGCQGFDTTGDLPPGGSVFASTDDGIERIYPALGGRTPEGIGVGADLDDVRRAYPDAQEQPNAITVPLGDGLRYVLELNQDGAVTSLALAGEERVCLLG